MDIITYKPQNPDLWPFISYYYQQEYTQPTAALRYQCFPHLNLSISLFERACFHFDQRGSFVTYHPHSKPLCLLTHIRSNPLWVHHKGPLRKIAVVFEPLGLQALSQQPLLRLARGAVTPIDAFGGQLTQLIPSLFATASPEEWVNNLDSFFLTLIKPLAYPVLSALIQQTTQVIDGLPLHQIADQYQLSRRHMGRLFQYYLGCSPETYRQIARFRYVLQLATQVDGNQTFTELAYRTGHADQAHWNKQCRKWTGYTPSTLLTVGTQLGQQDLFWRLIEDKSII